jgi:hypothetical protein
MKHRPVLAAIGIVALILLQLGTDVMSASPKPRPFKGRAQGTITDVSVGPSGVLLTGFASGNATPLGLFTRHEHLLLDPTIGSFTGDIVFTAANGDELWCILSGNFISATDATGVYTITGGTGRFENAIGEAEFFASLPDGVHYTVDFDGSLDN